MTAPTHIVTSGPHAGLRCRIHATGGSTVSVTYSRNGWRFPLFAVVRPEELAPIVMAAACAGSTTRVQGEPPPM